MKYIVYEYKKPVKENLSTNNQVAFSDWHQGCSMIPKGIYALYFTSTENLEIVNDHQKLGQPKLKVKMGEFVCKDDMPNWKVGWHQIEDLKWVNLPIDNISEFNLLIECIYVKGFVTPKQIEIIHGVIIAHIEEWKFRIFIKTTDESGDGVREKADHNASDEFCIDIISTVGPNKTLDAICPYDPFTREQIKECLNWRRIDRMGSDCNKFILNETKKESIKKFCDIEHFREDCKCVNRKYYSDYQKLTVLRGDEDYCWYFPCKSGAYLIDEEKKVECKNGNTCIISYNNSNVGGDVNFNENTSAVNCSEMKNIPTGRISIKKGYLVFLSILLVVFIFLK